MSDDRQKLLNLLKSQLPDNSAGVEVGVWRGDFSERLLEALQPSVFYLVDPWLWDNGTGQDKHCYIASTKVASCQHHMDKLYLEVVRKFHADTEVRVLRLKSVEAADLFGDQTFDWVYIDGAHDFASVQADLAAWAPKVRPGGFLCGDDYKWKVNRKDAHCPVERAVKAFLVDNKHYNYGEVQVFQSGRSCGQFIIPRET